MTMKVNFTNSATPRPKKLLINYRTVHGWQFHAGSTHHVDANESGQIALKCPISGGLVFFGRSEWM
ncbi:MAG: hypothetical protein KCHDKBKB_03031 [Elusimicrobia bacterium]|nr:hypothetical protein [Elusimicrobiota bacterium]